MKDLTQQRFGKLLIIARQSSNDNKHIYWRCQCDCGNIKIIRNEPLLRGETKSCGCLKKSKEINLIGQKFGRLLVLKKGISVNGRKPWICRCDCGKIVALNAVNLHHGTKSCGCLFKERFLPKNKKCRNAACIMKPIDQFHIRKRVRYNGVIGQSVSKYCKDCEKLRKYFSNRICAILKQNKAGKSFFNYVGYSIADLKQHLEKQFEPWMSWQNHGKYDPRTWSDHDLSSWKWNIDHIKPHSTFKYTSMEEDNFKKCWALSNLRPYSAKLNVIEGNRR